MDMLFIVSYMALKWVEHGPRHAPRLVEVAEVVREVQEPPPCKWVCRPMPQPLTEKHQGATPRITTCYYPALCTLKEHYLHTAAEDESIIQFEMKP